MMVSNSSPAASVGEFIEYAKAKGETAVFASSGTGASPHLTGELFRRKLELAIAHVPYRSVGSALSDVMAGRADVMFATMPSVLTQIRSKAVRALAVTSTERSKFAPEIPTLVESGVTDFEMSDGYGIFCPPDIPTEVVRQIHDDTLVALDHPLSVQRFGDLAVSPAPSSAAELTASLRFEMAKWGPIIRELGIRPE
jgi:tripartite-type tricarboxylate transporter receptor subunit TctC